MRRASGSTRMMQQLITLLLSLALATGPVAAQQAQGAITPNYKDADIRQVIEAVGAVTGKNFVLDPRVKAQVTMLSSAPMTPDAFYEAFLSILAVYGYIAVPSGNVVKILPDANARQVPGAETGAGGGRDADDMVTRILPVRNVAAAQLVPILRPLIPQYGHLAAHPQSNMLIISDRAANVERMQRIIERIDTESTSDIEVIRLENASAAEVVRVITTLGQGAKTEGGAAPAATVVADERTNSVLVSGDKTERLRLRTLVAHLDTPLQEGGDTRVRYLRYAEAKDLATKLQAQYQKQGGGTAQAGANAAPPTERGEVSIWADESTNALIITAPPKVMKAMMAVIDKVDIRRMQVLVESLIVEVSADKASELGVNWAVGDADLENMAGVTRFDLPNTGGGGIIGLAAAAKSGDTAAIGAAIGKGLNMAVGRVQDSGTSFAALINALASDANTNIVGTPVLVTMDNEEAEIKVGQEVPFVTGQFTNTGATSGGTSVNPFQTIQREQVGLTLKLTPQINEGDAVLLKIEQVLSALAANVRGAADLVTTNRSITTSVIVEDGGTLVLGGLIQDDLTEQQQRVPLLGSIPLLGQFFRVDSTTKKKTNLMVFIKPTILRDDAQAAFETNAKYNFVRNQQLALNPEKVRLMPGETRPMMPPIAPAAPPALDLRQLRLDAQQPASPAAPDANGNAGQPAP
ncbi:MAG: type II secretion system protein GspD [Proteobacteria bacterium]|nr:MAG: type II secretion system protein GspD [Pseudomonadota bacterium]MBC6944089.1 type II secretion system protein GspD [Gammaproteobacteria bacterium]MCE7897179.1 type II secretion system protein GspD [Gammaproteobacteria bacterium PRO8]MCQ3933449.1 type II secretion system protein GspD [Gammaproteobacteria bacterium]MDL1880407.1 type II secretion system protein GspD [Gammaproteobacteria bacterium PRO2]